MLNRNQNRHRKTHCTRLCSIFASRFLFTTMTPEKIYVVGIKIIKKNLFLADHKLSLLTPESMK